MKEFFKTIGSWISNINNLKLYKFVIMVSILLPITVGCGLKVGDVIADRLLNGFQTKYSIKYTRDVYIHRLESKYDASREALAEEIDKYIDSVAPTADLDALNLIDLSSKYNVDLRLILAQGHVESHFGTKGTAARTNSVFNVGAFDGHSASMQIKNGYGYRHPDFSVEPYLKLLTSRYLVEGKSEEDLLESFVDKNGSRYASSKNYENALKSRWKEIDSVTNITEKYSIYKKYKLKLGR